MLPSVSSGGLTRTTPQRELKMSGKRGRAREQANEGEKERLSGRNALVNVRKREQTRFGNRNSDSITGKTRNLRLFVLHLLIKLH